VTIQDILILRKLDEKVTAGNAAAIGTQYGDITVHPTRAHGFVAEIIDPNNVKRIAFGYMPSNAFCKLAETIKEIFG
jgi:hypothetical protein